MKHLVLRYRSISSICSNALFQTRDGPEIWPENAKDRGIIITISGLPIKEKNLNVKIQYSERLSQGNLFNLFKECMATNQGSDRVVIDQFTFNSGVSIVLGAIPKDAMLGCLSKVPGYNKLLCYSSLTQQKANVSLRKIIQSALDYLD